MLTAVIWLAMIGLVVTWEQKMPQAGERFSDLSRRRRVLHVLVFPVCIAALWACFNLIMAGREQGGGLALAMFIGVAAGFAALLALALHHSVRAIRTRTTGRPPTHSAQPPTDQARKVAPRPKTRDVGDQKHEQETQRQIDEALHRWQRFTALPVLGRIPLACAVAATLLIPGALLMWAIAARSEDDRAVAVVSFGIVGIVILLGAVIIAIWPQRAIRWSIRSSNAIPTRMPAYRTPLSGENYEDERRDGD